MIAEKDDSAAIGRGATLKEAINNAKRILAEPPIHIGDREKI